VPAVEVLEALDVTERQPVVIPAPVSAGEPAAVPLRELPLEAG